MAALVQIQKIKNSAGNIGTPLDTPSVIYKMKGHLPYFNFLLDFSMTDHPGKKYLTFSFKKRKILVIKNVKKNFCVFLSN